MQIWSQNHFQNMSWFYMHKNLCSNLVLNIITVSGSNARHMLNVSELKFKDDVRPAPYLCNTNSTINFLDCGGDLCEWSTS